MKKTLPHFRKTPRIPADELPCNPTPLQMVIAAEAPAARKVSAKRVFRSPLMIAILLHVVILGAGGMWIFTSSRFVAGEAGDSTYVAEGTGSLLSKWADDFDGTTLVRLAATDDRSPIFPVPPFQIISVGSATAWGAPPSEPDFHAYGQLGSGSARGDWFVSDLPHRIPGDFRSTQHQ